MNVGEGKTHGPLSEWACVTPRGAELTAHELWKGIFSQCQELHLPSYISVSNLAFFLDIFFGKRGEFCSRKKKMKKKRKNWKQGWERTWLQKSSTEFWGCENCSVS